MMLKIIGIQYKEKFLVSIFSHDASYNKYSDLNNYIVNGIAASPSFEDGWSIISFEPKTIEKLKILPDINHRFELIDKSLTSENIPNVLIRDEMCSYVDYEWVWNDKYSIYQSLYQYKSDKQEPVLENVEFEYKTIAIIDDETIERKKEFSYEVYKSRWSNEGTTFITYKDIDHQLVDKILFPPILLPIKPCELTPKQSYDIVRMFIKQNINYQYASITSDYDFCFTVKKKIKLYEQEQYTVDVNLFNKREKPKYETRFRNDREVEIFNMAPSPYQNYNIIKGFRGNNQDDLKNKIDKYCKELMDFINDPVVDCKHCKGRGVILDTNFMPKTNLNAV